MNARGGRTVMLVFDEVSRLFPTGYDEANETGCITALGRDLQIKRNYQIWTLLLPTQSCVQYISIAEWADPSGQVRSGSLKS